jgi:ribose transport system ATP-binding protein
VRRIRRVADGIRDRIAYVSEDRKGCGLVLAMDTEENITLANLRNYARPVIQRKRERAVVEDWVKQLNIRVGDVRSPVVNLSGGNQQKVAVAKWLDTKPEVLILDEPTRGIDVGSKQEIYALIHRLASEGLACLLISSEMQELIGLCHRIVVLREGRVMGELEGDEMTEEKIMYLAAGVEPEVAA